MEVIAILFLFIFVMVVLVAVLGDSIKVCSDCRDYHRCYSKLSGYRKVETLDKKACSDFKNIKPF